MPLRKTGKGVIAPLVLLLVHEVEKIKITCNI